MTETRFDVYFSGQVLEGLPPGDGPLALAVDYAGDSDGNPGLRRFAAEHGYALAQGGRRLAHALPLSVFLAVIFGIAGCDANPSGTQASDGQSGPGDRPATASLTASSGKG